MRTPSWTPLASLKDPKGAEAIAQLLPHSAAMPYVRRALRKMGPVAERAVLSHLNSESEPIIIEACRVLKEIGTNSVSGPKLRRLVNEVRRKNRANIENAAKDALQSIARRTEEKK